VWFGRRAARAPWSAGERRNFASPPPLLTLLTEHRIPPNVVAVKPAADGPPANARRARRAAWASPGCVALSLAACLAVAPLARADDLPSADELRERRLFREERPLWRKILAAPAGVPIVLTWPLKQMLFWAERVDLPDRISDAVRAPFRGTSRGEAGS
jgi:hypothetical protein